MDLLGRAIRGGIVAGMDLGQGLSSRDGIAALRETADADRGVDLVFPRPAAGASLAPRASKAERGALGDEAFVRGLEDADDGCSRKRLRCGIAPLRLDPARSGEHT